jgi:hypothetical protein
MEAIPAGNSDNENDSLVRRYANDLAIEVSLSTCELRFGQRAECGVEPVVGCRIVASPVHLATFGRVIQASIARYEARFGAIPDSGAG